MVVVIASKNEDKIYEFRRMLKPLGFDVISKHDAGMDREILETGSSFEENAKIKAIETYKEVNMPVIADDSGLEVLALNGAPGIYSARYSADNGLNATSEDNNKKLLKELDGIVDRRARYVCALCFVNERGRYFSIVETCDGEIANKPEGNGGFGYDPLFKIKGVSFANMRPEEKDAISHRGKALLKLAKNIGEWK